MNDRENLAKLLIDISYDQSLGVYGLLDMRDGAGYIADLLIANGVTVQNWRDAKTDPPTKDGQYLTFISCDEGEWIETDEFDTTSKMWRTVDAYHEDATEFVTHWMPKLGTPLKGDNHA